MKKVLGVGIERNKDSFEAETKIVIGMTEPVKRLGASFVSTRKAPLRPEAPVSTHCRAPGRGQPGESHLEAESVLQFELCIGDIPGKEAQRMNRRGSSGICRSLVSVCLAPFLLLLGVCLASAQTETPAPAGQGSPLSKAPSTSPATPALVETLATPPPDPFLTRERVLEALQTEGFSYNQVRTVDPFVSFITPLEATPPELPMGEEELEPPPEPQRPLTPLQKMSLGELEKGLTAIAWGELGRRALIEDSAGKGYIVSVGTPAGDKNGIVTEIFNDRIIVQQQVWDRKAKRLVPRNSVIKLKKEQPK